MYTSGEPSSREKRKKIICGVYKGIWAQSLFMMYVCTGKKDTCVISIDIESSWLEINLSSSCVSETYLVVEINLSSRCSYEMYVIKYCYTRAIWVEVAISTSKTLLVSLWDTVLLRHAATIVRLYPLYHSVNLMLCNLALMFQTIASAAW